jgi:hypothetical protein
MIDNGPVLWAKLLAAIEVPGAIVSGGCIRDWHLGLAPKDIDIFVPGFTQRHLTDLCDTINDDHLGDLQLQPGCGSYSTMDDPLVGVVEGTLLGYEVNILSNRKHEVSVLELIQGHDFGICQSACDIDGNFTTTEAFEDDLGNRTATILTLRSYERSLKRFDKFTSRNGTDHLKLVDPFQHSMEFTIVAPVQ